MLINPYRFPAGGPQISDDFNRADASTLGTTPVGGKTWVTAFTGTGGSSISVGIESNRAFLGGVPPGDGNTYAYVDSNSANIDASVTLSVLGSTPVYASLIARFVDTNNFVLLQYDSNVSGASAYGAYKRVAGTYTNLGYTSGVTPTDGDVIRLVVSGTDTVDFYIGAAHFGPFTATDISSSSVNVGLASGISGSVSSTARFDNFLVV